MHLKTCMSAMAQPTEKAIVKMETPTNFRKNKPTKAEIRCPNIIFLGCAKGDCDTV
ncbi:hypothetical protein OCUAc17_29980 [Acinetobacter pittii]|nr:hypothetical protein OCUAc17_29980 [Acinetobacter pittii]